jgi:hypothetical protein
MADKKSFSESINFLRESVSSTQSVYGAQERNWSDYCGAHTKPVPRAIRLNYGFLVPKSEIVKTLRDWAVKHPDYCSDRTPNYILPDGTCVGNCREFFHVNILSLAGVLAGEIYDEEIDSPRYQDPIFELGIVRMTMDGQLFNIKVMDPKTLKVIEGFLSSGASFRPSKQFDILAVDDYAGVFDCTFTFKDFLLNGRTLDIDFVKDHNPDFRTNKKTFLAQFREADDRTEDVQRKLLRWKTYLNKRPTDNLPEVVYGDGFYVQPDQIASKMAEWAKENPDLCSQRTPNFILPDGTCVGDTTRFFHLHVMGMAGILAPEVYRANLDSNDIRLPVLEQGILRVCSLGSSIEFFEVGDGVLRTIGNFLASTPRQRSQYVTLFACKQYDGCKLWSFNYSEFLAGGSEITPAFLSKYPVGGNSVSITARFRESKSSEAISTLNEKKPESRMFSPPDGPKEGEDFSKQYLEASKKGVEPVYCLAQKMGYVESPDSYRKNGILKDGNAIVRKLVEFAGAHPELCSPEHPTFILPDGTRVGDCLKIGPSNLLVVSGTACPEEDNSESKPWFRVNLVEWVNVIEKAGVIWTEWFGRECRFSFYIPDKKTFSLINNFLSDVKDSDVLGVVKLGSTAVFHGATEWSINRDSLEECGFELSPTYKFLSDFAENVGNPYTYVSNPKWFKDSEEGKEQLNNFENYLKNRDYGKLEYEPSGFAVNFRPIAGEYIWYLKTFAEEHPEQCSKTTPNVILPDGTCVGDSSKYCLAQLIDMAAIYNFKMRGEISSEDSVLSMIVHSILCDNCVLVGMDGPDTYRIRNIQDFVYDNGDADNQGGKVFKKFFEALKRPQGTLVILTAERGLFNGFARQFTFRWKELVDNDYKLDYNFIDQHSLYQRPPERSEEEVTPEDLSDPSDFHRGYDDSEGSDDDVSEEEAKEYIAQETDDFIKEKEYVGHDGQDNFKTWLKRVETYGTCFPNDGSGTLCSPGQIVPLLKQFAEKYPQLTNENAPNFILPDGTMVGDCSTFFHLHILGMAGVVDAYRFRRDIDSDGFRDEFFKEGIVRVAWSGQVIHVRELDSSAKRVIEGFLNGITYDRHGWYRLYVENGYDGGHDFHFSLKDYRAWGKELSDDFLHRFCTDRRNVSVLAQFREAKDRALRKRRALMEKTKDGKKTRLFSPQRDPEDDGRDKEYRIKFNAAVNGGYARAQAVAKEEGLEEPRDSYNEYGILKDGNAIVRKLVEFAGAHPSLCSKKCPMFILPDGTLVGDADTTDFITILVLTGVVCFDAKDSDGDFGGSLQQVKWFTAIYKTGTVCVGIYGKSYTFCFYYPNKKTISLINDFCSKVEYVGHAPGIALHSMATYRGATYWTIPFRIFKEYGGLQFSPGVMDQYADDTEDPDDFVSDPKWFRDFKDSDAHNQALDDYLQDREYDESKYDMNGLVIDLPSGYLGALKDFATEHPDQCSKSTPNVLLPDGICVGDSSKFGLNQLFDMAGIINLKKSSNRKKSSNSDYLKRKVVQVLFMDGCTLVGVDGPDTYRIKSVYDIVNNEEEVGDNLRRFFKSLKRPQNTLVTITANFGFYDDTSRQYLFRWKELIDDNYSLDRDFLKEHGLNQYPPELYRASEEDEDQEFNPSPEGDDDYDFYSGYDDSEVSEDMSEEEAMEFVAEKTEEFIHAGDYPHRDGAANFTDWLDRIEPAGTCFPNNHSEALCSPGQVVTLLKKFAADFPQTTNEKCPNFILPDGALVGDCSCFFHLHILGMAGIADAYRYRKDIDSDNFREAFFKEGVIRVSWKGHIIHVKELDSATKHTVEGFLNSAKPDPYWDYRLYVENGYDDGHDFPFTQKDYRANGNELSDDFLRRVCRDRRNVSVLAQFRDAFDRVLGRRRAIREKTLLIKESYQQFLARKESNAYVISLASPDDGDGSPDEMDPDAAQEFVLKKAQEFLTGGGLQSKDPWNRYKTWVESFRSARRALNGYDFFASHGDIIPLLEEFARKYPHLLDTNQPNFILPDGTMVGDCRHFYHAQILGMAGIINPLAYDNIDDEEMRCPVFDEGIIRVAHNGNVLHAGRLSKNILQRMEDFLIQAKHRPTTVYEIFTEQEWDRTTEFCFDRCWFVSNGKRLSTDFLQDCEQDQRNDSFLAQFREARDMDPEVGFYRRARKNFMGWKKANPLTPETTKKILISDPEEIEEALSKWAQEHPENNSDVTPNYILTDGTYVGDCTRFLHVHILSEAGIVNGHFFNRNIDSPEYRKLVFGAGVIRIAQCGKCVHVGYIEYPQISLIEDYLASKPPQWDMAMFSEVPYLRENGWYFRVGDYLRYFGTITEPKFTAAFGIHSHSIVAQFHESRKLLVEGDEGEEEETPQTRLAAYLAGVGDKPVDHNIFGEDHILLKRNDISPKLKEYAEKFPEKTSQDTPIFILHDGTRVGDSAQYSILQCLMEAGVVTTEMDASHLNASTGEILKQDITAIRWDDDSYFVAIVYNVSRVVVKNLKGYFTSVYRKMGGFSGCLLSWRPYEKGLNSWELSAIDLKDNDFELTDDFLIENGKSLYYFGDHPEDVQEEVPEDFVGDESASEWVAKKTFELVKNHCFGDENNRNFRIWLDAVEPAAKHLMADENGMLVQNSKLIKTLKKFAEEYPGLCSEETPNFILPDGTCVGDCDRFFHLHVLGMAGVVDAFDYQGDLDSDSFRNVVFRSGIIRVATNFGFVLHVGKVDSKRLATMTEFLDRCADYNSYFQIYTEEEYQQAHNFEFSGKDFRINDSSLDTDFLISHATDRRSNSVLAQFRESYTDEAEKTEFVVNGKLLLKAKVSGVEVRGEYEDCGYKLVDGETGETIAEPFPTYEDLKNWCFIHKLDLVGDEAVSESGAALRNVRIVSFGTYYVLRQMLGRGYGAYYLPKHFMTSQEARDYAESKGWNVLSVEED